MKPADLRPGRRITLRIPSYDPSRHSETLTVLGEPFATYDSTHDRTLIGIEVAVDAADVIGHGELMVRAGTVRVEGVDESPAQYRVYFPVDVDVAVEN